MKRVKGGGGARGGFRSPEVFFGLDEDDEGVCSISSLAVWNEEQRKRGAKELAAPKGSWVIAVTKKHPNGSHSTEMESVHPDQEAAMVDASDRLGAVRLVSESQVV